MSVLTEFTVPAEEFMLETALGVAENVRVEIERVVADEDTVTPYFWVSGEDVSELEGALADDPTVESTTLLEEHEGKRFYRSSWRDANQGVMYAVSDAEATILSANAVDDEWRIRMLFPDEDELSEFHDYCVTYGLSFELTRLYESRHPEAMGKYDVTEKQREALVAALELGYFEVPRGVTLAELAEELGISPNALSTRLRRGSTNLVSSTLAYD